jgi:hypothetical protein
MRKMESRKLGKTQRFPLKMKRYLRNLRYKFRFLTFNFIRYKPSLPIIASLIIGFSIFLLIGGVYDIIEIMTGRALALLPSSGGWTFIYPGSLHMQTINESLVAALLYLLGIIGFYLLLKGIKLAYKPRQAYLTLTFGFILLLLITYYSTSLLASKIGG